MIPWSARSPMPALPLVVLGSGAHARVLIDTLRLVGARILGYSDQQPGLAASAAGAVDFLGGEDAVFARAPSTIYLVNAVGPASAFGRRDAVFQRFRAKRYRFAQVVHPAAVLASGIALGEGTQVMAGAVIQPGCAIGDNVVVNAHATIEHDCVVGNHTHIGAGAVLTGGVSVGAGAYVGAGATVVSGLAIGAGSLIAAGATVIEPVAERVAVAGSPARVMVS